MMKWFATFIFLASLTMSSPSLADIYIVTPSGNKEALDLGSIKEIFQANKQEWSDGKKVILVVPDVDSPEGKAMLEKVFGMTKEKFKKYWLGKLYRGEISALPENKTGDSMKQFLKSYPYAIGILQGSQVDGELRKAFKLD